MDPIDFAVTLASAIGDPLNKQGQFLLWKQTGRCLSTVAPAVYGADKSKACYTG